VTQPSAFREAFAPTARAMLSNVAVTGRDNAADAARIVKAIWTDERMEDVWRELHRMSRAEPVAFHFPARAGQWLRRANATAAERQAAGVCYLAEQAAWTALQGWPTATDAEMQANGTKADAGYLLRVERHRTAADLRGFVVTMSGCACLIFGTPLHGGVATLAAITLGASVDGAQVKQMVRGLAFDLRRNA